MYQISIGWGVVVIEINCMSTYMAKSNIESFCGGLLGLRWGTTRNQ